MLSLTGQALLIDFLPMGVSDEFTVPKVLEMSSHGILNSVLSAPADIYSFRLVFWQWQMKGGGGCILQCSAMARCPIGTEISLNSVLFQPQMCCPF